MKKTYLVLAFMVMALILYYINPVGIVLDVLFTIIGMKLINSYSKDGWRMSGLKSGIFLSIAILVPLYIEVIFMPTSTFNRNDVSVYIALILRNLSSVTFNSIMGLIIGFLTEIVLGKIPKK